MRVLETNYGKEVSWGYNCEEHLRDLRKLNDEFSTHHPDYESFCKRSDALNAEILEVIEKLDKLCKRNEGRIWSKYTQDKYDSLTARLDTLKENLDDLCIYKYPARARELGYSYCV